jgi:flagellar hook protein FlgE
VADNIANSSTTGYKRASMEFSALVLESGSTEFNSGSIESHARYAISEQGGFKSTTSTTDLAIKGDGFFVVSDDANASLLTRAGSFVKDAAGNLVNAAGYTLMGYNVTNGISGAVANGTAALEPVNIGTLALEANASTEGQLYVNLPSNAAVVPAGTLPSDNVAGSAYTAKTSLVTYDNLGNEVTVDIYSTKTNVDTWEVAVFDRADAASGGGFPYGAGPLATGTLNFVDGHISGPVTSVDIPIPGGTTMTLDMSQSSQLATSYTVLEASANGNSPSTVDRVEIADNGTLYAVFDNGARYAAYQVAIARVPSPDNLLPLSGNVYAQSVESGDIQIGIPGSDGFGSLVSSALEQSTVDLASELTSMIESERNYTANSKVFQTGAELMDVLVNLKR